MRPRIYVVGKWYATNSSKDSQFPSKAVTIPRIRRNRKFLKHAGM